MTDKIDISAEAVLREAQKFIDDWFNNPGTARPEITIPAKETNTDIALVKGVRALSARLAEVEAERDSIMETLIAARVEMTKAITRAEAAEAQLAAITPPDALIRAAMGAVEVRLRKTENIIGSTLSRLDDALAPPDGHISMHAQGQTPEWFVEAAHESCYLIAEIRALADDPDFIAQITKAAEKRG